MLGTAVSYSSAICARVIQTSSSFAAPWVEDSMFLNILSKVSFRFSSEETFFLTFENSSFERMKKLQTLTRSSRACSALPSITTSVFEIGWIP